MNTRIPRSIHVRCAVLNITIQAHNHTACYAVKSYPSSHFGLGAGLKPFRDIGQALYLLFQL